MKGIAILVSLGLLAPGLAAAQTAPAYRSEQIIDHFTRGGDRDLGATRGLCIGTASECRVEQPAPPTEIGGFDLVVTFELDSAELTPAAIANLDEFVAALSDPRLAGLPFAVEGHTDATGSLDYNLDLSRRRAESVVRHLSARGIPRDRLTVEGYGPNRPRTDDPYDPGNRRVETRIAAE